MRHGGGGGDDGVVARWREREDKKYQVISGKCFCRRTGSAEGKKGRWSDTKDGRARRKKKCRNDTVCKQGNNNDG